MTVATNIQSKDLLFSATQRYIFCTPNKCAINFACVLLSSSLRISILGATFLWHSSSPRLGKHTLVILSGMQSMSSIRLLHIFTSAVTCIVYTKHSDPHPACISLQRLSLLFDGCFCLGWAIFLMPPLALPENKTSSLCICISVRLSGILGKLIGHHCVYPHTKVSSLSWIQTHAYNVHRFCHQSNLTSKITSALFWIVDSPYSGHLKGTCTITLLLACNRPKPINSYQNGVRSCSLHMPFIKWRCTHGTIRIQFGQSNCVFDLGLM